jgi:SAM-dependent methyltransferase
LIQHLSFRDPGGFVIRQGERLLRAITPEAAPAVERLLTARWFRERVAAGSLPASHWTEYGPTGFAHAARYRWVEHELLRFPCYPHEITAAQLHDAASLTVSLALEALDNGWILKDASAWNVLFEDGRPIFCDILSFEPGPAPRLWPAYAQFQRHFIIPLLLFKYLGIRPDTLFLKSRDGVRPEDARQMLKGIKAWRQPTLEAVTLPALLKQRPSAEPRETAPTAAEVGGNPKLTQHLLARTFRRLQRHLRKLAGTPAAAARASAWVNYELQRNHYTAGDLEMKRHFVAKALADTRIDTLLDLGCNTGEFSFLAAELGKKVVAADADGQSLERLYARVRERGAKIQPLVLDIGRPTPAVGWMNAEIPSWLARASGQFDCIMMLGLLHHLLVSERARSEHIFELIRTLAPRQLIIEWVEPSDPRFRELAGINASLYEHLSRESFEAALAENFMIEAQQPLPGGTRFLYACSSK